MIYDCNVFLILATGASTRRGRTAASVAAKIEFTTRRRNDVGRRQRRQRRQTSRRRALSKSARKIRTGADLMVGALTRRASLGSSASASTDMFKNPLTDRSPAASMSTSAPDQTEDVNTFAKIW